jgi:hypothetical protein
MKVKRQNVQQTKSEYYYFDGNKRYFDKKSYLIDKLLDTPDLEYCINCDHSKGQKPKTLVFGVHEMKGMKTYIMYVITLKSIPDLKSCITTFEFITTCVMAWNRTTII